MVAATSTGALLLDDCGTGKPILFFPSLLNPHVILDLSERNSLLKFLSGRGSNVFLVDWGWPAPGDRELGLKGHIEHRLLPMLAALGETPVRAGYCLGGTVAAATCELMAVSGLVKWAAPWNYADFRSEASWGG